MCTLLFAYQVFEDPIVVAANRDEELDQPADPPAVRDWGCQVLAPVDLVAGGTWIGYNEHGVFVGLTNRFTDRNGTRSRGLLVRDALGHESADAAVRCIERSLQTDSYSGCNLVVTDERSALIVEYDGRTAVRPLRSGVHVLVNVGADGRIPPGQDSPGREQAANADRVRSALQPEPGETGSAWLDRAATVLADHEYGICIHRDEFGTHSSSRITGGPTGVTFEYADGPPCSNAYDHQARCETGGDPLFAC